MELHASILIFGLGIIGVNIIVLILETLDTRRKRWNICKFVIGMQTYRQFHIIIQVVNTITSCFLPVFTLTIVILAVVMGHMIIKMTGSVPHSLVILEIMTTAAIVAFIMIAYPLCADVLRKSADFLRSLELQGGSMYRKRQLYSCRPLKIRAGSYFYIHDGTVAKLLELIAYYTMSSIISV